MSSGHEPEPLQSTTRVPSEPSHPKLLARHGCESALQHGFGLDNQFCGEDPRVNLVVQLSAGSHGILLNVGSKVGLPSAIAQVSTWTKPDSGSQHRPRLKLQCGWVCEWHA